MTRRLDLDAETLRMPLAGGNESPAALTEGVTERGGAMDVHFAECTDDERSRRDRDRRPMRSRTVEAVIGALAVPGPREMSPGASALPN